MCGGIVQLRAGPDRPSGERRPTAGNQDFAGRQQGRRMGRPHRRQLARLAETARRLRQSCGSSGEKQNLKSNAGPHFIEFQY